MQVELLFDYSTETQEKKGKIDTRVTFHQYNRYWGTSRCMDVQYIHLSKLNCSTLLNLRHVFWVCMFSVSDTPLYIHPPNSRSIVPSHSTMRRLYYGISVKGIPSAALVSDFGDVEECFLEWFSQVAVWHPSEHRAGMLLPQRDFVMSLLHRLPLWWRQTSPPSGSENCASKGRLFLRWWNLRAVHPKTAPQANSAPWS